MLTLVLPAMEYYEEIAAYKKEFLDSGSDMAGCGSLARMDDISQYIDHCHKSIDITCLKPNYVPSIIYLLIDDIEKKVLGMCQIRLFLNVFLYKYSGHIGYSVRPSQRRKGYAKSMLSLALSKCAEFGIRNAMVSCEPQNEGSRRTILANGGRYISTEYCEFENISLQRYWCPTGPVTAGKHITDVDRTVELMFQGLGEPQYVRTISRDGNEFTIHMTTDADPEIVDSVLTCNYWEKSGDLYTKEGYRLNLIYDNIQN